MEEFNPALCILCRQMAGGGQEEAASLNSVVQQCVEVNQYQQQQQAEHDINAATGDLNFIYC